MQSIELTLEAFIELYPEMEKNRKQLASIAGCKLTTVNHWFASGGSRRHPSKNHQLRLGLYHWFTIAPEPIRQIIRQSAA
jgi:hypothetical protein